MQKRGSLVEVLTIMEGVTSKNYRNSKALQKKSHALIPGGAHTYAKGDDQYPEDAPGFLARGEGCHVWDIDGNEFIDTAWDYAR